MKIILISLMMVFGLAVHAESKEETKLERGGEVATGAGSKDIDGCFECNKDVADGLKEQQKTEARQRDLEVNGKAQPGSEGDSTATREKPPGN